MITKRLLDIFSAACQTCKAIAFDMRATCEQALLWRLTSDRPRVVGAMAWMKRPCPPSLWNHS